MRPKGHIICLGVSSWNIVSTCLALLLGVSLNPGLSLMNLLQKGLGNLVPYWSSSFFLCFLLIILTFFFVSTRSKLERFMVAFSNNITSISGSSTRSTSSNDLLRSNKKIFIDLSVLLVRGLRRHYDRCIVFNYHCLEENTDEADVLAFFILPPCRLSSAPSLVGGGSRGGSKY